MHSKHQKAKNQESGKLTSQLRGLVEAQHKHLFYGFIETIERYERNYERRSGSCCATWRAMQVPSHGAGGRSDGELGVPCSHLKSRLRSSGSRRDLRPPTSTLHCPETTCKDAYVRPQRLSLFRFLHVVIARLK